MANIVTLSLDDDALHLWKQIEYGKRSEYVRGILKNACILDAHKKRIRALEKQNLRLLHKTADLRFTLAGELRVSDEHSNEIVNEVQAELESLRKLVEEFASKEEGDFE